MKKINYEKCKIIEKYDNLIRNIKFEIIDMILIVEHIVVLKLLNELDSSFNIYLIILNEQARRENKFSTLNDLLKNLKNEKTRMRQNPVVVANMLKTKKKKNLIEENKNKCKCCDYNHFEKCRHSNATCKKCNKIDHLKRVCESKKDNEISKSQIVCTIRKCFKKKIQKTSLICMTNLYRDFKNAHDLLIDFDVIAHIICNNDLFQEETFRNENNRLKTGFEKMLSTEKKDSLLVSLDNENESVTNLILINVLLIFDLKFNLISTIQFDKKNISTYLKANDKLAQLIYKERMIELIKTINDQYVLQTIIISFIETRVLVITNSTKVSIQT